MDPCAVLEELGLTGAAYAAPVDGGEGVGFDPHELVIPASVLKISVALAVENAIAARLLVATERRMLRPDGRTPGPVGISLLRDDVSMSIRDLVVTMLTIGDNVATDALIAAVGLDEINRTTGRLGMTRTRITSDLRDMLDALARDAGLRTYAELVAHDPDVAGPPSHQEVTARLAAGAVLDPARGSRTTAAETITLLQAIWTDRAGPAQACAAVRQAMSRQLTRDRIASGFGPDVAVSAKTGGLMGIVRNEAGVVAFPDGPAYAVAVFTRREPGITTTRAETHAAIGRVARALVDDLRGTRP